MDISLCVVAKIANESATIFDFTSDLLNQFNLAKAIGVNCHLIYVIDDFSKDTTLQIVRKMAEQDDRIQVFYNESAQTLVDSDIFAYRKGIESNSDWIVDINAGFRHQPKDLKRFLEVIQDRNIDAVLGSRYLEGGKSIVKSRQRQVFSKEGTRIGNLLLGTHYTDLTSGFMMLRRQILIMILEKPVRSRFHFLQTEIKFRIWLVTRRVVEVPIEYRSVSGPLKREAIFDAVFNLLILTMHRLILGTGNYK